MVSHTKHEDTTAHIHKQHQRVIIIVTTQNTQNTNKHNRKYTTRKKKQRYYTGAVVETLGLSLDQRSIDLIKIGSGPKKVWITARQHPGESMASWFVEGLVHCLLEGSGKVPDTTFFIVFTSHLIQQQHN